MWVAPWVRNTVGTWIALRRWAVEARSGPVLLLVDVPLDLGEETAMRGIQSHGAGGVVNGSATDPRPPLVTVAGLYGAGTSRIGPRIAEQLGVPYLDRDIVTGVAKQLGVAEESVESYDPEVEKAPRSGIRRFFASLGNPATADTSPASDQEARRLRSVTAAYLGKATAGGGVVIGRGGMVVLRDVPGVLHVRLEGARDSRVEQAMRIFDFDRQTAEQRQKQTDRARDTYVHDVYGVDPDDPGLYHLRIDSTMLQWDICVELIVAAARAQAQQRGDSSRADAGGEAAT